LRPEPNLTSPTQADLITDFEKTLDFIGLSAGLQESDVILESTFLQSGSSATLVKLAANGSPLALIAGVQPADLRNRFVSYQAEPLDASQVAELEPPTAKKLSDTSYQIIIPTSDGSQFAFTFLQEAGIQRVETLEFLPSSKSGSLGSTMRFSPTGEQIDWSVTGSSDSWRLKVQDKREVVFSKVNGNGTASEIQKFPLSSEQQTVFNTSGFSVADTCEALRDFCKKVSTIGDFVGFGATIATLSSVVTGPFGLSVAGALSSIGVGLKVLDYLCALTLGNQEDLGKLVIGSVADKGLSTLRAIKAPNIELGDAIITVVPDTLKLRDAISPPSNEKPSGTSKNDLLVKLRKSLSEKFGVPFDVCDKASEPNPLPTPTPTPTPTPVPANPPSQASFKAVLTPQSVPFGSLGNLEISFTDPTGRAGRIDFSSSAGGGSPFIIPADKRFGGTFNFSLQNVGFGGGDCQTLGDPNKNAFVGITVKTSTGEFVGSLGGNVDFGLVGKGSIGRPCGFTITPV
jgi:hypothetical protein